MKDKIKDFLYKGISNLGYKFTPRAYSANLDISHHLRDLFAFFRVSCVFDVGANTGQYRNFLRRRCGYRGLIVSFEPVRSTFDVLASKAKSDKNWLVFNYALGSKNEEREFNVMRDSQFSSFLEPRETGLSKPDMANIVERRENVTVRRLDSLIQELAKEYDMDKLYLKIDTQGHDLEVLKGVGEELSRIVALQSEVAVKPIYEGMPTFLESITELARLRFELTGLFPVNRDLLFRVIEFDCVALNHASAAKLGKSPSQTKSPNL